LPLTALCCGATLAFVRLFVAIELAEQAKRAAEKTARTLQRQLGETLPARWADRDHMHLTVRFIGHVADERVPSILEALRPAVHLAPFPLALGACGAFPAHGPPRVLWIGLKEGVASMKALHDECNRRLRPLGFTPEDRPYRAHLTLARVKDAPRGSGSLVRNTIRNVEVPAAQWIASHATVFESHLSPSGSTYARRLEIPLI
jgi:RNA 2',3'-cyclic 3'-phosphodiesterase